MATLSQLLKILIVEVKVLNHTLDREIVCFADISDIIPAVATFYADRDWICPTDDECKLHRALTEFELFAEVDGDLSCHIGAGSVDLRDILTA